MYIKNVVISVEYEIYAKHFLNMKGIALFLTLLVTAMALAIVLGLTNILIASLASSRNIHISTVSFYVADSGIEGALFEDRNGTPLPDGFVCKGDGDGATQGPNPPEVGINENIDTCLDQLTNGGTYSYTITGVTPNRVIRSQSNYQGVTRAVEIHY